MRSKRKKKSLKKRTKRRILAGSETVHKKTRWSPVHQLITTRKSLNKTKKKNIGASPHLVAYNKYADLVTAKEFHRTVPINTKKRDKERLEYFRHPYEDLHHIHHGQRKLLMSEIEFLVDEYDSYKNFDDIIVVYVGAAPGIHINVLANLFPMFTFHLYDKTKYDSRLKNIKNIRLFSEYFTDSHAHSYSHMNIIFISDIRNLDVSDKINRKLADTQQGKDGGEDQDVVQEDMEKQKNWFKIINPLCGLLKFRLPWKKGVTKYLDGKLYYQVWGGKHTSESRLSPKKPYKMRNYDHREYEEKMHFFNRISRRQIYKNDVECYGNCYDCFAEIYILSRFLDTFILPNEPNKKDIPEIKEDFLCALRYMIDDELGKKLF